MFDKVLGYEQKVEQKQEAGSAAEPEEKPAEEQQQAQEKGNNLDPAKLNKGEIIPYNGTEYKVVAELKNKVYQMLDLDKNRKFKMSSKDELFNSLLNARNNSQEM